MPLKLLTFNSAASQWINPSDSVLIKIYSSNVFSRVPLAYCTSVCQREIQPAWLFWYKHTFVHKSKHPFFIIFLSLCGHSFKTNEFILGNSAVNNVKFMLSFRTSAARRAFCFFYSLMVVRCSKLDLKQQGSYPKS